jgi:hypothetical protein
MKKITHILAGAGALVTALYSFPGVHEACSAFLAAHSKSAAWVAFAALVAALYHNPKQPGSGY